MERIKQKTDVFVFENEEQAQIAIDVIDASQGLPTDECTTYIKSKVIDGNVCIIRDSVTELILGGGWITIEQEFDNPFT